MLEKIYNSVRMFVSRREEKGKASSGFLPPRVREKALSAIEASKGALLEVGCGEGFFVAMAARKYRFMKITGLEVSEDTLESAKRRIADLGLSNVRLIKGNAEDAIFEEGSFDYVVSLNMLYNLKSQETVERVIREMTRVCKKTGSILFDIRNKSNPFVRFAYKNVKSYDPECPWSLLAFTVKDVRDLLHACNLRVRKIMPIAGLLGMMPLSYLVEAEKQ